MRASKQPDYVKEYNRKYYNEKKNKIQENSKLTFQMKNHCVIFTDGSCFGNPGEGGWGVLVLKDGNEIELSGYNGETTNNRMELLAAIKALEYIVENEIKEKVILYTDSTYVFKGATLWMEGWKARGWTKLKNVELWRELDYLKGKVPNIQWNWVKAHNGNKYNEKVDGIAKQAIYRGRGFF